MTYNDAQRGSDLHHNEKLWKLIKNLTMCIGDITYYQMTPTFVLTVGARNFAQKGSCYWLFDLYQSHLTAIDKNKEPFTVLKLQRVGKHGAQVTIEDGNSNTLVEQHIEYTDIPMRTCTLYGVWDGNDWVAMLPSEY